MTAPQNALMGMVCLAVAVDERQSHYADDQRQLPSIESCKPHPTQRRQWRFGVESRLLVQARRSQKRSLTWNQFNAYLRRWLPKARIVHDLYPVPWWKTQTGSRMV
jgi:hypothetical protein